MPQKVALERMDHMSSFPVHPPILGVSTKAEQERRRQRAGES